MVYYGRHPRAYRAWYTASFFSLKDPRSSYICFSPVFLFFAEIRFEDPQLSYFKIVLPADRRPVSSCLYRVLLDGVLMFNVQTTPRGALSHQVPPFPKRETTHRMYVL